jgi:N-acetylmuramoyl-L-alanine amidase
MGIGYQFVIRANGVVERGRAEWSIGSHSGPQGNGDSIGVCLTGNFENSEPTEAQLTALVELIRYLRNKYGNLSVIGHKDVVATACPGKHFPWVELQKRLEGTLVEQWKLDIIARAKNAGLIADGHDPNETASKWFVLAMGLNLLKILRGGK